MTIRPFDCRRSSTVGKVDIVRVSGTHFGRHSGLARMFDYVSFVHRARKKLKQLVTGVFRSF